MKEKYLSKYISVVYFPYSWIFGIGFFDGDNLFSIQFLCFALCFWKRPQTVKGE